MALDGILLRSAVNELYARLVPGRVEKVMQPEKDEIHLMIRSQGQTLRLLLSASPNNARAHLSAEGKQNPQNAPMFCMLMRKALQGGRLLNIRQSGMERIVRFEFEALNDFGDPVARQLVLEIMGRHSNLILINEDGIIVDSARHVTHQISRVREVLPGLPYADPPGQDKRDPENLCEEEMIAALMSVSAPRADKLIASAFTGVSLQSAQEMLARASIPQDAPGSALSGSYSALAHAIAKFYRDVRENRFSPCMIKDEENRPVDCFPFRYSGYDPERTVSFDSPSALLDAFFIGRDRLERRRQKTSALEHTVNQHLLRAEKKLALQMQALEDAESMDRYRLFGELLTASLHLCRKGQTQVSVPNYYEEDATAEIPLDPQRSPSENAQHYYKLYTKARGAKELAARQKEQTQSEIEYLLSVKNGLERADSDQELAEIRAELEQAGYLRAPQVKGKSKNLPPSKPMRFVSDDGTEILVGKNNTQNDLLTLKTAKGDEMWLHVQKLPGSHVIVRSSSPSERTIREAAALAAYFSAGRDSSRVPVDYTLRKFVKKPSGAKPGMVIYTNQRTLYVTPERTLVESLGGEAYL